MRYLWLLIVPMVLAQSGCDTTYPNEEMDIEGSDKTRPFAIVCSFAEATPGMMVSFTLHYYEPDPEHHDVTWKIALDYDLGLYEADEERDIVEPDITWVPTWDEYGFCVQTVILTIPDDVLLRASSQPDVITDELVLALARPLLEKGPDEPVTKGEIDTFLINPYGTPGSVMDEETMEAVRWLSDLFACRIRVRATIDGTVTVDVTKTLTVRYSREFNTLNVNMNPVTRLPKIVSVPHPDVPYEDFTQYGPEIETYEIFPVDNAFGPTLVPLHHDWTYFLLQTMSLQNYLSPFGDDLQYENYSIRWYHYGLTGAPGHALFAQDDGDEAEMFDLDKEVRLIPPARSSEHAFRIVSCVRDMRLEWSNYGFTPGVSLKMGEFIFNEQ